MLNMNPQERAEFAKKYGLTDPYLNANTPPNPNGTQPLTAQDGLRELEEWRASRKQTEQAAPEQQEPASPWLERAKGVVKSVTDLPRGAAEFGKELGRDIGETDIGKSVGGAIRSGAQAILGKDRVQNFAEGARQTIDQGLEKNPITSATNEFQEQGKMVGDIAQAFVPIAGGAKVAGLASKVPRAASMLEKSPRVAKALEGLLGTGKLAAESALTTGVQTGSTDAAKTAGGFTALAPLPFKAAKSLVKKVIPKMSGVAPDIYADVFARPDKYDAAAQILDEHPNEPFLGLAETISTRARSIQEGATQAWKDAAIGFRDMNPNAKFDISAKLDDIKRAITGTEDKLGFGLKAVKQRKPGAITEKLVVGPNKELQMVSDTAKGKLSGPAHLEPSGKVSGWTDREMNNLNDLVSSLQNAKGIGPEEVIEMDRVFGKAYDAVPFNNQGTPTRYHAAVMALKKKTEEEIEKILPEELSDAYRALRVGHELQDDFVSKIADREGNLRDSASSFLSNLVNKNKGEVRIKSDRAKGLLGFDPVDAVKVLKNATLLREIAPRTGSRTFDMLRSYLTGGVGAAGIATGNPLAILGSATSALASSPQATGAAVKKLGKLSKDINPELLKQAAPAILKALGRLAGETVD